MLSLIVPVKVNVGAAAEQDVSDWLAGLTAVVAPSASAGVFGGVHDSVYVAGLEAAATGLVTTSTASPLPGSAGGAIASGATAIEPGPVKVRVAGAEFSPSDCAQ